MNLTIQLPPLTPHLWLLTFVSCRRYGGGAGPAAGRGCAALRLRGGQGDAELLLRPECHAPLLPQVVSQRHWVLPLRPHRARPTHQHPAVTHLLRHRKCWLASGTSFFFPFFSSPCFFDKLRSPPSAWVLASCFSCLSSCSLYKLSSLLRQLECWPLVSLFLSSCSLDKLRCFLRQHECWPLDSLFPAFCSVNKLRCLLRQRVCWPLVSLCFPFPRSIHWFRFPFDWF